MEICFPPQTADINRRFYMTLSGLGLRYSMGRHAASLRNRTIARTGGEKERDGGVEKGQVNGLLFFARARCGVGGCKDRRLPSASYQRSPREDDYRHGGSRGRDGPIPAHSAAIRPQRRQQSSRCRCFRAAVIDGAFRRRHVPSRRAAPVRAGEKKKARSLAHSLKGPLPCPPPP